MLGRFIEGYIRRPNSAPSQSGPSSSSILNNPIIANLLKFNPLGWVIEAVTEEIGEDVQIPLLNLGIGSEIFKLLGQQFDLLLSFLKRSWASFEAAIGEPESVMVHLYNVFRDGFWSIFDSLKNIILAIFSVLMETFSSIAEFCRGKWMIPYITDIWEELTDTGFTPINFVSYVAAQLLELFNFGSTPVLESLGLAKVFENCDEKKMPSIFPPSLIADIEAHEGSAGASFEEQLKSSWKAQKEGTAYMAANPVTKPRFGLMMDKAHSLEGSRESTPSIPPPSKAVRYVSSEPRGLGLRLPFVLDSLLLLPDLARA